MKRFLKFFLRWEVALLLILALEIFIFGKINPRFLRTSVLLYSINDFICVSIISVFMAFVVIGGGIDISVGSLIGLSSVVLGLLWKQAGFSVWTASLAAVAATGLCGFFSGFLVAYTGVQSMVVTLGGLFLFSGVSLVVVGLSGVSAFEGIGGYPQAFINISAGSTWGLPNLFLIFIALTAVAGVLLHCTRYGRYIYLIGINENSARYSGIPVKAVRMSTYIISGISAGIAGVVLTSYLGSSRSDLGAELVLPIVTAIVLGGVATTGGQGGVVGVAIASVVVGIMRFGLQMSGISSQYITIGTGLLLVISVAMRSIVTRK